MCEARASTFSPCHDTLAFQKDNILCVCACIRICNRNVRTQWKIEGLKLFSRRYPWPSKKNKAPRTENFHFQDKRKIWWWCYHNYSSNEDLAQWLWDLNYFNLVYSEHRDQCCRGSIFTLHNYFISRICILIISSHYITPILLVTNVWVSHYYPSRLNPPNFKIIPLAFDSIHSPFWDESLLPFVLFDSFSIYWLLFQHHIHCLWGSDVWFSTINWFKMESIQINMC